MKIEDFFNQQNVIELSFFNFENAITAAYFARENPYIPRGNPYATRLKGFPFKTLMPCGMAHSKSSGASEGRVPEVNPVALDKFNVLPGCTLSGFLKRNQK